VGVKARWFNEIPAIAQDDPFRPDVEEIGMPIDLRDPPALTRRLVELVEIEAALHTRGVTCEVRDRPDTACCACPLARSSPDDPLWPLCRVGQEQERVCTELAIHKADGGGGC
jgi:hypothetical protein